jgi:ABC-type transport system involved in Fe-S cluster assembly fused permease/ATPase subunit
MHIGHNHLCELLRLLPVGSVRVLLCVQLHRVDSTCKNELLYCCMRRQVYTMTHLLLLCDLQVTLWRKKFRKQVAKSDNDWHDKCTDSLINFETVKYFTAEEYEKKR